MARIRTIKPEFFTSEDIVSLSPMARLLFIATWCEADKEGRLIWRPKTLKLRYFPADDCNIEELASELVTAGLIVLYGDGLAHVPGFGKHQHINPRETASTLPEPDASARVGTRRDASARDSDAQGGREGKGKEGKGKEHASTPRVKKSEQTLGDWALSLPDGEELISDEDTIYDWAAKQGIPRPWIGMAWFAFESRYGDNGKRYADWRAVFRKAMREDWLKLWRTDGRGGWVLTTAGEMAQREMQA